MYEFIDFLKDKKAHYEISDSFASDKRYRQKEGNGYIDEARKANMKINLEKAEPNQKWHLTDCYYDESTDCKKNAGTIYKGLKCPELLLWIAEATGIDSEIVNKAAIKAREIIDGGVNDLSRNDAGYEIRKMIPWEMIEEKITKDRF